jgi:hypothetical protein
VTAFGFGGGKMQQRFWFGFGLSIALLVAGDLGWAQEGKDTKKEEAPPQRLRGQLPPNYRKLGLSDEQVQKIYRIQADFQVKVKELEEQIKKLKSQEKSEIEKVLTKAQRDRLKEIITGEEKKDDKKDDK